MNDVAKARSITLDDLVSTATRSAIKTYRENDLDLKVPPRIWVGIRIEPADLKELGTDVGNP